MFGKLKYLFLYCYEATERMEEKSAELAEERQKRMEQFRAGHDEMRAKAQEKFSDARGKIKEQMRDVVKEVGLVTHDEVEDIKTLITDLSARVDKLAKK